MIDLKAKAAEVCKIIAYVTDLPVTHIAVGPLRAGAPTGPYCVVTPLGDEQWGQAMKSDEVVPGEVYDDVREFTKTQKVLQFSINMYRDNAASRLGAIKEANKRHPVQLILRAAGLGWQRVGPTQNLTGLFAANSEERFQCSLYLYAEDSVSDIVQTIYDVEYGLSVDAQIDLAEGSVNVLSS